MVEGEIPASDSSEKVAAVISSEIIGLHLLNRSVVNVAGSDLASGDQVAEPLRDVGVVVVVVGGHFFGRPRDWRGSTSGAWISQSLPSLLGAQVGPERTATCTRQFADLQLCRYLRDRKNANGQPSHRCARASAINCGGTCSVVPSIPVTSSHFTLIVLLAVGFGAEYTASLMAAICCCWFIASSMQLIYGMAHDRVYGLANIFMNRRCLIVTSRVVWICHERR